jgi:Na+-translocating ferredoxin:NAD+ oxidoreductase subunit E
MIKTELKHGIIDHNPVFVLAAGLCPALAVTTNLKNAAGMGIAVLCVLIASNVTVSVLRKWIPYKIRIPCYLIVISAFVSMADIFMKADFPDLERNLGIFVPLIAVNCIVIGRAEAFASKSKVGASIVDGIATGLGFCLALIVCAIIREGLGENRLFGAPLIPHAPSLHALQYACGGFFSIALVIGVMNHLKLTRGKKK